MLCLYFLRDVSYRRLPDPDDHWDNGHKIYHNYDFRLVRESEGFTQSEKMSAYDFAAFYDKDPGGKILWVVYNEYSDGNTFGCQDGYIDAVWVGKSKEEAEEMAKRAKEMDYGYFGSNNHTIMREMLVEEI